MIHVCSLPLTRDSSLGMVTPIRLWVQSSRFMSPQTVSSIQCRGLCSTVKNTMCSFTPIPGARCKITRHGPCGEEQSGSSTRKLSRWAVAADPKCTEFASGWEAASWPPGPGPQLQTASTVLYTVLISTPLAMYFRPGLRAPALSVVKPLPVRSFN